MRIKKEKNFWDVEIIGNRRKKSHIPGSNPAPDLRNFVPDNDQVVIPMLSNQETTWHPLVPDPMNGLEALSRMKSLKLREPKFEKQAKYI